jgi:hypothetical protein
VPYIVGMETIYALLVFAAAIVIIYVGGRWNTSDVDHYMGFDNLRSPRRGKASNGDKDPKKK